MPARRLDISPHTLPENLARAVAYRRADRQAANPLFGYDEFRRPKLPDWLWHRIAAATAKEQQRHKGRTPVVVLYDRRRDCSVVVLRLEDWRRVVGQQHGP